MFWFGSARQDSKLFHKYRVFRKNCVFFIIYCNPSLANKSLQEIFKTIINAMYSHSYFRTTNTSPVFCEGEVAK